MSVFLETPSIFEGPPLIPDNIKGTLRFELESNAYYKRLKNITWIFLELVATSLVIGILWITVDWVKIIVTGLAIGISLVLLLLLGYIF